MYSACGDRIDDYERMITFSGAVQADIDEYYGERPHQSMRAIVIKLDGVSAGIIGLSFERDHFKAFSEYKPALEPYLKSMTALRAIKAAQRMFTVSKRPILAVREGCAEILERVGFEALDEDTYLWRS